MGCGGFAGMAVVGLGLPAWVCGGPILVVGLWWLWVVDFAGGGYGLWILWWWWLHGFD
jgi:hypothetical protein